MNTENRDAQYTLVTVQEMIDAQLVTAFITRLTITTQKTMNASWKGPHTILITGFVEKKLIEDTAGATITEIKYLTSAEAQPCLM